MAEAITVERPITTGERTLPLYPPSWIDRLTDWVRRLPVPGWLFYLGLWLSPFALVTAAHWADGSYPVGTIYPVHALMVSGPAYFLALMHYLDDFAGTALQRMRPVLTLNDTEYERLRYEFTRMPARQTLRLGIIFAVAGFALAIILLSDPRYSSLLKPATSPLTILVSFPILVFAPMLEGIFVYHTIRQLRLINHTYTKAAHVNLFRLGPLYSLSALSARTVAGWVLFYLIVALLVPEAFASPLTIGPVITIQLISAASFVWPLLGVHHMLEAEKQRLTDDNHQQMEAAVADLHDRLSTGQLEHIDLLEKGMEGLVIEQNTIDKLATWPWHPGTARGLAAALLLPVFIWVVQRILDRLMGF
jgi:hypothetical protein